jgi:hypothetical protein
MTNTDAPATALHILKPNGDGLDVS